jgi:hypothetical protein
MRTRVKIVVEVRSKNAKYVLLVNHDDMIEAFATNRANEPFAVRIGLRRRIHPMVPIRRNFFRSRIPSIH